MQSVDSGSEKRPFSVHTNAPGVGSYVSEVDGPFVVVMLSVVESVESVENMLVGGVVSVDASVDGVVVTIVEGFSVGWIGVTPSVGHL